MSGLRLILHISLGDTKAFVTQALTLSFLIALISGSIALTNALHNTLFTHDIYTTYTSLLIKAFKELKTILEAWSIPICFLIFSTTYILTLHSLNELEYSLAILYALGASKRKILSTIGLRSVIMGFLGWLLGLCLGLVGTQILFRIASYIFHGPYEIPALYLFDVVKSLLYAFTAIMLGCFTCALHFSNRLNKLQKNL